MRPWIVKGATLVLMLGLALVLGLLSIEGTLRLMRDRTFLTYQPCFRRGGRAIYFFYQPGCTSVQQTSHGPVNYSFNEDGLRDGPRENFAGGTVLALGDSIVKGLYLDQSETIPALLNKSGVSPLPVLNGGIRWASPITESLLFRKISSVYDIRYVIWFLNGTDTIDERFYRALSTAGDGNGVPVRFSSFDPMNRQASWIEWAYQATHGRSYMLELARQWMTYRWFSSLARQVPADKQALCGGIGRLAADLERRKIPLMVVFTPHPAEGIERVWVGEKYDPAQLAMMAECAREAGAKVLDLSGEEQKEEWYVEDRLHLRPAGAEWIAGRVAAELPSFLKERHAH